jgi:hypothetical protein
MRERGRGVKDKVHAMVLLFVLAPAAYIPDATRFDSSATPTGATAEDPNPTARPNHDATASGHP